MLRNYYILYLDFEVKSRVGMYQELSATSWSYWICTTGLSLCLLSYLLAPSFLGNIRRQTLSLKSSSLDTLLEKFGEILATYQYQRNPVFQSLTVRLLRDTMHIWIPEAIVTPESGEKTDMLCAWLVMTTYKLSSWQVRDSLVQFLDDYVTADPDMKVWPKEATERNEMVAVPLPWEALPELCGDMDIRVRLRACVASPRLLQYSDHFGMDANQFYTSVRSYLTTELTQ